jgi:hypothetical protein
MQKPADNRRPVIQIVVPSVTFSEIKAVADETRDTISACARKLILDALEARRERRNGGA